MHVVKRVNAVPSLKYDITKVSPRALRFLRKYIELMETPDLNIYTMEVFIDGNKEQFDLLHNTMLRVTELFSNQEHN